MVMIKNTLMIIREREDKDGYELVIKRKNGQFTSLGQPKYTAVSTAIIAAKALKKAVTESILMLKDPETKELESIELESIELESIE